MTSSASLIAGYFSVRSARVTLNRADLDEAINDALLVVCSVEKRCWFCLYDGPSPESLRRAASRNRLPIHEITEILVLDPYAFPQK